MPEANADAIWDSTLSILRRDDTVSQRVMALLTLSRLMAVVADTALLAVPSTSAKELFEHRIAGSLKAALSEATGRDIHFAVTVDESLLLEDHTDGPGPSAASTSPVPDTGAHSVDNRVDSRGRDVHTTPFRRNEGSVLPSDDHAGRAALPLTSSAGSAGTGSAAHR